MTSVKHRLMRQSRFCSRAAPPPSAASRRVIRNLAQSLTDNDKVGSRRRWHRHRDENNIFQVYIHRNRGGMLVKMILRALRQTKQNNNNNGSIKTYRRLDYRMGALARHSEVTVLLQTASSDSNSLLSLLT